MYSLEELQLVAELAKKHNVAVISDEVYEYLVYPPKKHIRMGMWCVRLGKTRYILLSLTRFFLLTDSIGLRLNKTLLSFNFMKYLLVRVKFISINIKYFAFSKQ